MKTNILFSTIATLLIITFFFSCSKDIETTSLTDDKLDNTSLVEFKRLADEYKPRVDGGLRAPNEEKVKKIIKADVKGAGIGVAMGAVGGPWGVLIGGIIVGGLNSYAHSGIAPDPNGGNNGWVDECDYHGALSHHTNPKNPLNEIGIHHNDLLVFLADQQVNGTLANPENWSELVNASIPYMNAAYPDAAALLGDPAFIALLNSAEGLEFDQMLSMDGADIYNTYINTIEFITDPNDYYQFTMDYENLVMNSFLMDEEKDALLAALAVSRNSFTFWSNLSAKCWEDPTIGIFFQDWFCQGPGNALCTFPPTFPIPLPLDYAVGNVSVDGNNTIFIELNQTNLSSQTVNEIVNSKSIQVANLLEIDNAVIENAYLEAGLSPNGEQVLLEPGLYDVGITGDMTKAIKITIGIETWKDKDGKRHWKFTVKFE